MSRPREPAPAKLFLSLIYSDRPAADYSLDSLMDHYGPADYSTRELDFHATAYYQAEMGVPLLRRFFTFSRLLDPGRLVEVKLFTNALETATSREGKRVVNLDPGCLSLANLVLATGKAAAHRPYLGRGIYADLTLVFENASFRPLPWTYPDYAAPEMIAFLNRLREAYKAELRERKAEESGPEGTAKNNP